MPGWNSWSLIYWRRGWERGSFSARPRSLRFFLYVWLFDSFFLMINTMNNTVSWSCTKSLAFHFRNPGLPQNDRKGRLVVTGIQHPLRPPILNSHVSVIASKQFKRIINNEQNRVVVPVSKAAQWHCKCPVTANPLPQFILFTIEPDLVCLGWEG